MKFERRPDYRQILQNVVKGHKLFQSAILLIYLSKLLVSFIIKIPLQHIVVQFFLEFEKMFKADSIFATWPIMLSLFTWLFIEESETNLELSFRHYHNHPEVEIVIEAEKTVGPQLIEDSIPWNDLTLREILCRVLLCV